MTGNKKCTTMLMFNAVVEDFDSTEEADDDTDHEAQKGGQLTLWTWHVSTLYHPRIRLPAARPHAAPVTTGLLGRPANDGATTQPPPSIMSQRRKFLRGYLK